MKFSIFFRHDLDPEELIDMGVREILFPTRAFTRTGGLEIDELSPLLNRFRDFERVLVWDILMDEETFERKKLEAEEALHLPFESVRVQDLGAAWFMRERDRDFQLILDHGNHNSIAVQTWAQTFGSRLSKVVLSNELTHESIREIRELLPREIEIEILGYGSNYLFYSPRNLLSANQSPIRSKAHSEEKGHKEFDFLETEHGTLMISPKEIYILDRKREIQASNIDTLRIDTRLHASQDRTLEALKAYRTDQHERMKELSDRQLVPGFFISNKSDVLFPKLKNQTRLISDKHYIGRILESVKDSHMIFRVESNSSVLEEGMRIEITTPEGRSKTLDCSQLKTLRGVTKRRFDLGEIAVMPYRSGIVAQSRAFICD